MAKGLPKSIIKKYGITKKAWSVYRGKKRTRKTRRSSNPKRRVKRRMPRRKRRSRRYSMTIPIAPIVGLSVGMAKPITALMKGNIEDTIFWLKHNYLGLDGRNQFGAGRLMNGLVPLVVGLLVHKFVGGPPLNFNKMLARARVPFIRI